MQTTFNIWKCPWQDATLLLYLFIWSELLCRILSIFNAFHMVDLYTRIPQQTSTTNPLKAILWKWLLQFASFLTRHDITNLTYLAPIFLLWTTIDSIRQEKRRRRRKSNSWRCMHRECCHSTSSHHWTDTVMSYQSSGVWCSAAAVGKGLSLSGTKNQGRNSF